MAKTELITTLHKGANTDIDVFPNIKKENIPSASIDESKVDPALLQKITPVVANPTIVGSEADLTSIQVGDTKYKVTGGGSGSVMVIDGFSNEWSSKSWTGLDDFEGQYIWTDGDDIYYSYSSNQYVLDKSTSTWSPKTWTGLTSFAGSDVWTDGDNIYYSNVSAQYVLDKSTSTWTSKTWSGLSSFSGEYIWTDGENVYCALGPEANYMLDKETSTWVQKPQTGLNSLIGANVWTDKENFYYSYKSDQYIFNKTTLMWTGKTWSGSQPGWGSQVWTDGDNIYYSTGSIQKVLDKSTSTWSNKTWTGLTNFNGFGVWTDGENIYYSSGSNQYVLNKSTHQASVLAKVAETGDYNDLINKPKEGMDITAQEIATYFEVCDVDASVTTEGNNVVLNLTNADIVTENGEPVLTTEVPNVSVQNNILGIE